MKNKVIALAAFVLISCSSLVLGGQNANSSTTMEPNHNMSSMGHMNGRRHRRHRRMVHRRHRHKMKMKMKTNINT